MKYRKWRAFSTQEVMYWQTEGYKRNYRKKNYAGNCISQFGICFGNWKCQRQEKYNVQRRNMGSDKGRY